jgi:hypothetical protein
MNRVLQFHGEHFEWPSRNERLKKTLEILGGHDRSFTMALGSIIAGLRVDHDG